jgi:chemotaxis receptor (MCP) glutamine deamidase CheD
MFPQLFAREHVGEKNIRWTLEFLHAHGIEIVDKNLGGHGYRKVSWTVGPSEPMVETVTPE